MSRLQDLKTALQNVEPKAGSENIRRSVYEQVEQTPAAREAGARTVVPILPAPERTPSDVNSLLSYYIRMTGSFARLNGDMLTQNLLVVASGLPEDVRLVSLESLMWIAGHFGEWTAAMILNHRDIQQKTVDALTGELALLQVSAEEREAAHKKAGLPFDLQTHCMELGLTEFTTETQLLIAQHCDESLRELANTELSAAVDEKLASYEQKDADDLGGILSNPVYLLIACNYNTSFMAELSDILSDVRSVKVRRK